MLANPPVYEFNEDGTSITDGVTVRLLSIAAEVVGAREASFEYSMRTDFAEVGNMSVGAADLTVVSLGMITGRCKMEGGYLYSDDMVIDSLNVDSRWSFYLSFALRWLP